MVKAAAAAVETEDGVREVGNSRSGVRSSYGGAVEEKQWYSHPLWILHC